MAKLNLSLNTNQAYLYNQAQVEALLNGAQNDVEIVLNSQIDKLLHRWGTQTIDHLNKNLDAKGLNASGNLRQSHGFESVQTSNEIHKFKIFAADYWEQADKGQPKGTYVPIDDLMTWIMNKGIRVRDSRAQSTKSVLQKSRSLAISIQKAIMRNGTIKRFNYKGSNYFTEVVNDEMLTDLSQLIAEITGQTIAISIKTNFETTNLK